jgi:flagellar L-ring protein precursor FlgH
MILSLAACTDEQLDRLQNLGKAPPLEKIQNPEDRLGKKIDWPAPNREYAPKTTNSIWQSDSKTFFRDPRARNVGDILTIKVQIADQAAFNNATTQARNSSEAVGVSGIFGFNKILPQPVSSGGGNTPSNLLSLGGNSATGGTGSINRAETITTEVAASITQVLANGNFVISGNQEIRVNYEVREVSIQGVVRPEDIASDNTISSTQIAEARISYGGKGALSDLQTPRYGEQLIDILSPF